MVKRPKTVGLMQDVFAADGDMAQVPVPPQASAGQLTPRFLPLSLVVKYEKNDIKKDIEKKDDSDIINPSIAKAGSAVAVTRSLGNIKEDIIVKEFGEIQTDEIIVTEEREDHIKERHPEDFELFKKYGDKAVTDPDYIIRDGKHEGTVFMVMKLPNTNLNVVVRIALESDGSGLKNSVMTFYRIRERNLKKLIEKNTALLGKDAVLYKKE